MALADPSSLTVRRYGARVLLCVGEAALEVGADRHHQRHTDPRGSPRRPRTPMEAAGKREGQRADDERPQNGSTR